MGALIACLGALLAGCSTSSPSGDAGPRDSDGGAEVLDAGTPLPCPSLAGTYRMKGNFSLCPPILPPVNGACVTQHLCHVIVGTDATIYRGDFAVAHTRDGDSVGAVPGKSFVVYSDPPLAQICAVDLNDGGFSFHCSVPELDKTCDSDATTFAFGLPGECCDLARQTCPDSTQRCTAVTVDSHSPRFVACMTPIGAKALGQPCGHPPPASLMSQDDCGAGLYCGETGLCERLCLDRNTCQTGEVCAVLYSAPAGGTCTKTCTLFGDTCPTGTKCVVRTARISAGKTAAAAVCIESGPIQENMKCDQSSECGALHTCDGVPTEIDAHCRRLCDDFHPCPADFRCERYSPPPSESSRPGFCTPS